MLKIKLTFTADGIGVIMMVGSGGGCCCIYLFIWGFTSLSTLYRSYQDG